jgi:hypothetical protein
MTQKYGSPMPKTEKLKTRGIPCPGFGKTFNYPVYLKNPSTGKFRLKD